MNQFRGKDFHGVEIYRGKRREIHHSNHMGRMAVFHTQLRMSVQYLRRLTDPNRGHYSNHEKGEAARLALEHLEIYDGLRDEIKEKIEGYERNQEKITSSYPRPLRYRAFKYGEYLDYARDCVRRFGETKLKEH